MRKGILGFLWISTTVSDAWCVAGRPDVLVFPRIVDAARSHLERLPRTRALEELLPEMIRVDDPRQTRRQSEMLARLVQQVPSSRLHFGRDINRVADLLENAR